MTRGKTRRRRGASQEASPPLHCGCPGSRGCRSPPWPGSAWASCRAVWPSTPPQPPSRCRSSCRSCRSSLSRSQSCGAWVALGPRYCATSSAPAPGSRGSTSSSAASQVTDQPGDVGSGSFLHPTPSLSFGSARNIAWWHFARSLPRSCSPRLPSLWQELRSKYQAGLGLASLIRWHRRSRSLAGNWRGLAHPPVSIHPPSFPLPGQRS